jgi:hypothetical protein
MELSGLELVKFCTHNFLLRLTLDWHDGSPSS